MFDNWQRELVLPAKDSHKGENGKVMVVGGSEFFHGAALWAVKVLSRLADMVYFASVPEVECVVNAIKASLWDFIYVPRKKIDEYMNEAQVVVFGLGMGREVEKVKAEQKINWRNTYQVMDYLIDKYPDKKWLIDAGGLQVAEIEWLKKLKQLIITPHKKEFEMLTGEKVAARMKDKKAQVQKWAKKIGAVVVLKGVVDIVSDGERVWLNKTGNEGMTKGGTGDVLAGLIAGLWVKNPGWLAGLAGVYINGLAGDRLYKQVGPFYNTSDLCNEVVRWLWHEVNKNKKD